MKIYDLGALSEKCVINLCDGTNLGYICDVRIDVECGKVCSFILPVEQGIFSFGKGETISIPWEKIECIGEDAILVRLEKINLCCNNEHRCKKDKKKFF